MWGVLTDRIRIGGGGLIAPAMMVAAAFFGGGTSASAESIGGAEVVVNEVKGNLAAGRLVAVLRGDEKKAFERKPTAARNWCSATTRS